MGFIRNICNPPSTKWSIILSAVIGVCLIIIDLILVLGDPLHHLLYFYSRVDYGTFTHDALAQEAPQVNVGVYLFNVTNSERFEKGLDHKLKVEEVGPFTYQERRTNEDLEIDHKNKVMRYQAHIRPLFLPEESIGRPEDFNITMPNIPMLGLASLISSNFFLRMGYNVLISQLKPKPMLSMPIADYLWGYDDPLVKMANTLLPGIFNFEKLGLMDRIYDKEKMKQVYEVSAVRADKFAIRTVDGSGGLDEWGYKFPEKRSACNTFKDVYEGIGYPPFLEPELHLRLYRSVFCRFFELEYQGPRPLHGAEGLQYKISNKTYTKNNESECLCLNGVCQDGISDLSPCFTGLPVVLSNAHFLYADPKLYDRIDGMNPDPERHGNSITIEPIIGISLENRFSIQVSLLLKDVSFNSQTSPYSNMLIPFLQLMIEQPPLTDKQNGYITLVYIVGPYSFLVLGLVLFIISVWLLSRSATTAYSHWITASRREEEKPSVEVPLVRR